jgi:uncharacterized membrane protein HdeD (DUF308 family)
MVLEFIFLPPFFVFHVPENALFEFALIVIFTAFSGIVASLSIYRVRLTGGKVRKLGTGLLGPIFGLSTGICGCGSFGFATAFALGSVGGTFTAFLTNYERHL